jgi:hypothetical protein
MSTDHQILKLNRPVICRFAQTLSAILWAGLGTVFMRYVTATHAWLDPRVICMLIMSPFFGYVVSIPHYQLPRRKFVFFKFVVYPLVQLCIGIVLLAATFGIAVAGTLVFQTAEWINAPSRAVAAMAWVLGLASNTRWIILLWLLAVINHVVLFLIQGGKGGVLVIDKEQI